MTELITDPFTQVGVLAVAGAVVTGIQLRTQRLCDLLVREELTERLGKSPERYRKARIAAAISDFTPGKQLARVYRYHRDLQNPQEMTAVPSHPSR